MSVYSGSEEEEMSMEFYAVPAVEGLIEGGKGPQVGNSLLCFFHMAFFCSLKRKYSETLSLCIVLGHIGVSTADT